MFDHAQHYSTQNFVADKGWLAEASVFAIWLGVADAAVSEIYCVHFLFGSCYISASDASTKIL
jgi:hypothetical protein